MRKFLIFVIVVAAVVFGVAPYIIGTTAEAQYEESMQVLEQQLRRSLPGEDLLKFDSEYDYQRGWLNAEGTTTWRFTSMPRDESVELVFKHDVSHVINPATQSWATIDTTLQMPKQAPQQLVDAFNGESPLTVTQHVLWAGGQNVDIRSPKAAFSDEEGAIEWGGIDGDVTISSGLDSYDGRITVPMLKGGAANGGAAANINGISMDFNGDKLAEDVWLGNGKMVMDKLLLTDPVGPTVDISGFKVGVEMGASEDDAIDLVYDINFAKLKADELALGAIDFRLAVVKLDKDAYIDFVQSLQKAYDTAENDADKLQALIVSSVEFGKRALAKKPEILLENFSIDTGKGVAKANGKVEYVGNLIPQTLEELPLMIAGLLANVHVEAPQKSIRWFAEQQFRKQLDGVDGMDEATIQQLVDQQVAQFSAMGFMQEQDDLFVSDIKFEQGVLTVNGQPMQL